jgi:16S rRNA (uracil1498-N3)-methyltransferase
MNLLLLRPENLRPDGLAEVRGRQLKHLQEILQVHPGEQILAGLINGRYGRADILEVGPEHALLRPVFDRSPPAALPLTLILALPRPKMLKRVLQTATTMGVKDLYLINTYKVEKSFWGSPWLQDDKIAENSVLGLEQAVDTLMPRVHLRKLFKPFVEDELPAIAANTQALVAHPVAAAPCPINVKGPVTLAIGPEGGFISYEVEKLMACGFSPVTLGARILRVETAVPTILARLFPG